MHVPILSSGKKNEKRKASVVSSGNNDDEVIANKEVKKEKKKAKKTKQKKGKARSTTPENPHPEYVTPAMSRSPSTMSTSRRADSVTQSYVYPSTSQTSPYPYPLHIFLPLIVLIIPFCPGPPFNRPLARPLVSERHKLSLHHAAVRASRK
jgi:hypothetical protein